MGFESKKIVFVISICLGFIRLLDCTVSLCLSIKAFEKLMNGSVLCLCSTCRYEHNVKLEAEWKPMKLTYDAKVRRRKTAWITPKCGTSC